MNAHGRRSTTWKVFFLYAALCSLFALGCTSGGSVTGDVLRGHTPVHVERVANADRLTDGTVARDGDFWNTDLASVFSDGADVEWDLGREVHVHAAYLQGDNNDTFFLAGSRDGKEYHEIWRAESVQGAGMRPRFNASLDAPVRYLRLTMRGGDPAVSATELAVFEATPATFPPQFPAKTGNRPPLPGENEALRFGIVTAFALLFHRWNQPAWLRWLVILAPLTLAYWAYSAMEAAWPPEQPVVDMVRAVSAAVAAAAVLRLALRPEDVMPRFVTGTLAAMAFLAMTTFYNMWQPQFDDVADGRHTWAHTWDMRVYFPTAKYFDELGFDGLYLASVKAYLEDADGATERNVASVELRDLRDYEMTTVAKVLPEVHAVKNRFSPSRWEQFKRDMSFFWRTMGRGGYLGSLRDHGGNATPAWLLVAHLMFSHSVASESVLLRAAWLDPLLLLGFFIAAWRTFGVRTALVCIVVYGSSTFPWFGSNWAGSTLRNDWMVLVGLGACALRTERTLLGGVLLAGAAMIRAFPALSVFFLVAPLLMWVYDTAQQEKKIPSVARILERARPLYRPIAGAAACVVTLVVLSSAVFGFSHSWGDWAHKIALHSVTPNVNHVGLRTLFQFDTSKTIRALSGTGLDWSTEQVRTLAARKPFFFVAVSAFTLLGLAAARGRDLRQAALLGMMMIPIYFYPSNYYLHYVFVLPLLVDYSEDPGKRTLWGLVSFVVLCICVSEYWGFEGVVVDERYVQWSFGALIGFLVIFVALARDGARARPTAAPGSPEPAA